MKKIVMENALKERAEEYGKHFLGMSSSYEAYAEKEDVVAAYTQGAKEQLTIDIEKVCNWLQQNADSFLVDDYLDTTEMVKELRKAIDEEMELK